MTQYIQEEKKHHYMSMSSKRNPALGLLKFTILLDPSLVLHCYILKLSDPFPSVYKKKNAFSLNDICCYTLTQETLSRGS